ncbi:hypothetical protein [Ruminiclostridium josui]|uniref:hypothetical protein n=1 Tax=Ruminiclostridium josui TaxID=1499 RepID=UPI0004674DB3|nr:hypothetical protein [Ruminiclostridium josui]
MSKSKKLFRIVLSMILATVMGLSFSVSAASVATNASVHDIYYTVYNEKGEIVKEGLIPAIGARYTWSGSITLDNGWYTAFMQPGPRGFYVTKDTSMSFSYTLNRNATIEYYFYQNSTSDTTHPNTWKSGTKKASSATITYTADKTNYYFVGITNASSDSITISNVSFVF